jgi:hypothetical protein
MGRALCHWSGCGKVHYRDGGKAPTANLLDRIRSTGNSDGIRNNLSQKVAGFYTREAIRAVRSAPWLNCAVPTLSVWPSTRMFP